MTPVINLDARAIVAGSLLLVAGCDAGYPPEPTVEATPMATVTAPVGEPDFAEASPAPEAPNYAGDKRVEIDGDVYRICDGHSGRMVFVYAYNGYKQSRGGIFVLPGQADCR